MSASEELIDLAGDAKICTCCGKPLADLGLTDAVEQIEIDVIVYRRVLRRKRCRQTCDCSSRSRTVTAPLPPKVLPKSIYGTSLWVHLLSHGVLAMHAPEGVNGYPLQCDSVRKVFMLPLSLLEEHESHRA